MKKIISALLIMCMMLSLCATLVPSYAVTHGYVRADANDDNEVSMADVLAVRKYIAGVFEDSDLNFLAADVTEDDDITNSDLLIVRKTVAGILDEEGNNTDAKYHVDRITADGKNICRYTIVTTADNECMKYSATVLQKYIREACGIKLAVSDDIDSVTGNKIVYTFDEEDTDALGKEGYRVFVDENSDIIIRCGSKRGPLYATYFFLEELVGYRFLINNIDYLYKSENVEIPASFDKKEVPVFDYRSVAQKGCKEGNFAALRANAAGIESSKFSREAKYGYGVGSIYIHAHSFIYQCGVNEPEQPCMTSEETYDQIMAYNEQLVSDRMALGYIPGLNYTQLSVSQNDNENFCFCDKCTAIYKAEESICGALLRLCNRVCHATREKYPDLEIYTIAYSRTYYPPKMTRPDENVCVNYCFLGCNNHTLEDPECTGNPRFAYANWDGSKPVNNNALEIEHLRDWSELTDNLWAWYYEPTFGVWLAPSPNVTNLYYDFKTCAEMGVKGMYADCTTVAESSYEYLKAYLSSRLMWNPLMSEEEFYTYLDEYLMIFYGKGWQNIRELLTMEETAGNLQGCWTNNFDRPFSMYNKQYMCDNYDKMLSLIEGAKKAAVGFDENSRLDSLQLHIDFLCLSAQYDAKYVNGTQNEKALYKERYLDFYRRVNDWGTIFTDNYNIYPHGCSNFPANANSIMNPMEWLSAGYTGEW